MSTSMSIKPSEAISSSGSSKADVIKRQVAQLKIQKRKVEDDKNLSDKEKEQRLKRLEIKINSLDQQINSVEKKEDKEKKADEYSKELKNIKKTLDPETAELMMKLKELTKAATGEEISLEDPEALKELSEELLKDNVITKNSETDNIKEENPIHKNDISELNNMPEDIKIENNNVTKEYNKNNNTNSQDEEPETIDEVMDELRKRIGEPGYIVDEKL